MAAGKKKPVPVTAVKYSTYKKDVKLGPGQVVHFTEGKGYFAGLPPADKPKPVKKTVRERFVDELKWGVAHEPQIHYEQRRPIPTHLPDHTLPLYTDCSGFLTICAKWAGAPDPNGRGFNGEGFTGDMLQHCLHIRSHDALPGDLIVYGDGSGHHVTGIVERKGADFLVSSHGTDAGPRLILNSVEAAFQPSPQTFLRFIFT